MLTDPEIVAVALAAALDRLGVSYLVGGSIASSVHGFARATRDIGVVADLPFEQVSSLVEALQGQFYVDTGMILDAIVRPSSFNVIHMETLFKAPPGSGALSPLQSPHPPVPPAAAAWHRRPELSRRRSQRLCNRLRHLAARVAC